MSNDISITVRWSHSKEEGIISFSSGFKEATPILKADLLKDASLLLGEAYRKRLVDGIFEKVMK